MNKILIPIFPREDNLWLVVHGTQMAERIGGKVYVVEIKLPTEMGETDIFDSLGENQWHFKQKTQKEVKSEYCCVRGNFFEQCLKIIEEKRIDWVVLTIPREEKYMREVVKLLRYLKDKGICRVKLVKKIKKDGGGYVSHVFTYSGK